MTATGNSAPAPFEIRQPNYKTYSFENKVPTEFKASSGSKLSISKKYYKGKGKSSLRWDWNQEGAYITFTDPKAFKNLTGQDPDPIVYEWITYCPLSTLSLWIFSENNLQNRLWLEIGNGRKVDSRFYFNLNYSGWKELRAMYGRDLEGFPDQKTADTLTIHAPKGIKQGTLYIDLLSPRTEQDVRFVKSTDQMPYVRHKKYTSTDILEKKPVVAKKETFTIEPPEKLNAEQKKILRQLEYNFLEDFRSRIKPSSITTVEAENVLKIRSKYSISRNGDFVSGAIGLPKSFYRNMNAVANAYHRSKNKPEINKKMLDLYMDMCDLVIQHGHGAWYGLRSSFISPLLSMRNELIKYGRYSAIINKLKSISGVGDFYFKSPWGNADDYNTEMRGRIAAILMQKGDCQKWADLEAFKRWLDYTCDSGEIKPDGTFFHHNMIYSGYNIPAIKPLCQIMGVFHGTPFFSEKMFKAVRRSLIIMSYYSNDSIAHMFSGRWRGCAEFNWSLAQYFKIMAECGNPETGQTPDPETASLYLYYADRFNKNNKKVEKFKKLGIKPTEFDGHLSLNYAISSIHRRDDWMVVMRGMRKGILANEAYAVQRGNTMGRYVNYGQIQIFTHDNVLDDGFPAGKYMTHGWDYNFWPGTTTRIIPLSALRQHFKNVEATTTEYFAGGTSLDGNGIFGMKLQEELPQTTDSLRLGPPLYWLGDKEYKKRCKDSMYDTSFKARKSMFFFENRIVALGSGITSKDKKNHVATTLFQNAIQPKNRDKFTDSTEIKDVFPLEKTYDSTCWMINLAGIGYYIPKGNDLLKLTRKPEKKPYHLNWYPEDLTKHNKIEPNEGEIELAYLDHGKGPQNGTYEYCILIKANKNMMADFATKMAKSKTALYRVLAKDNKLHAIYDFPSRTTGYVAFEPGDINVRGILKSVDKPCMVMIKEMGSKIRVSLYNPDFDNYEHFGSPVQNDAPVKLELSGKWELTNTNSLVSKENASTFIVRGKDAVPVVFELKKQ